MHVQSMQIGVDMEINFGVDYYPEHWSQERLKTDVKLMKELGIQVVRLAEFSWHKLEPTEGNYDFVWLDAAVDLLGRNGIKSILGTPSAAPPAWMCNRYPDIMPIDREGRVRGFGGRHHDCQSNLSYRSFIRKMVTALANHYADNKNVIGWQPDNELGNSHEDLCTCNSCKKSFQDWLKNKYQTVQQLNKSWGNEFWSQEVNSFEEVFAPRITVTGVNPSAMLDWKKFHSDLIIDFMKEQTNIIRKYCKNQFITHNFMGFADTVDYYELGKELDFVSHDQYPGGFFGKQPYADSFEMAAQLDVVRSYKEKPFWIMEQQSWITGWEVMGRAPKPGQISAWMMQSVAHGADAVVFFRWRSCAVGTEQYWHGILPHSGNPGRIYKELQSTIKEMNPIMNQIKGSMPKAEVGILFSFQQNYAFKIQPHHPELSYTKQVLKYYKELYKKNIVTDFVPEDGDFGKYKLLLAPLQYLMSEELEHKYFEYVKNGGHLVLTMRTGVKDKNNVCMTERELPGRLAELTGVEVLDYDCLNEAKVKVRFDEEIYDSFIWSDILKVQESVKVMGTYASEFYAGEPCITKNSYQKGICYYVGTEPGEDLMEAFLQNLIEQARIKMLGTPEFEEIELMERESDEFKWIFAINHSDSAKKFQMEDSFQMIKGKKHGELEAFEVQIFERMKG